MIGRQKHILDISHTDGQTNGQNNGHTTQQKQHIEKKRIGHNCAGKEEPAQLEASFVLLSTVKNPSSV